MSRISPASAALGSGAFTLALIPRVGTVLFWNGVHCQHMTNDQQDFSKDQDDDNTVIISDDADVALHQLEEVVPTPDSADTASEGVGD